MGRFGFEVLGFYAVPFLCRRRELHHARQNAFKPPRGEIRQPRATPWVIANKRREP
jgi:hypothetical protein